MKVREVIKNRELADKQRKNDIRVYNTEEVLGSMKEVKDFSAFYTAHKESLEVIYASMLLDYCNLQSFTPSEKKAYQLGLDSFLKFFEGSEADTSSYITEAEQKNAPKQVDLLARP